ncbi:hypothetical protein AAMO2058_001598400 [Amorphochlora amoebiformis]|mmetsp:Transcript_8728/g.13706  ORF Transcript_8728/g.13706 Transcript_8728/m.13706 type:complete len:164 (-) Transcript_8728:123-614(-)
MRVNTAAYRRSLRILEMALSFGAFISIIGLGKLEHVAQLENLGLIAAFCFVYSLAAFTGDFFELPSRYRDTWILTEFALDFMFLILCAGGAVVAIYKCNETMGGYVKYCSSLSPYVSSPSLAYTATVFAIGASACLGGSLTIDYNTWLQSHLKYDDYEDDFPL